MPAGEDLLRVLLEHHRRDGPELLAALDVVEALEVRHPARVGQQAAVAQRARPELAAPLEPGDDAVGGQRLGHRGGDVVGALVDHPGAVEPGRQRVVVPFPAERRGPHRRDVLPESGGRVQRRAQRGARVPGGRLDPDLLERPLAQQPGVGHAVERDAARHRQTALAGLAVQPASEVEQHVLDGPLDRGGEVGVLGRPTVAALRQRGREGRPVDGLGAKAAVARGVDQLGELPGVARRPVGRHGHHLVLVRGAPEAQVRRQLLVEQAERVGQLLDRQRVEPADSVIAAEQRRSAFAAAVGDHHGRGRVRRGEVRRRPVCDVVAHEADRRRVEAQGLEEAGRPLDEERAQALPRIIGDAVGLGRRERRVIRVGNHINILRSEPGAPEAERDRLLRQLPGRERDRRFAVLAAAEALLLGRGDDPPVDDERGGRVVEDRVDPEDVHEPRLHLAGRRRKHPRRVAALEGL